MKNIKIVRVNWINKLLKENKINKTIEELKIELEYKKINISNFEKVKEYIIKLNN